MRSVDGAHALLREWGLSGTPTCQALTIVDDVHEDVHRFVIVSLAGSASSTLVACDVDTCSSRDAASAVQGRAIEDLAASGFWAKYDGRGLTAHHAWQDEAREWIASVIGRNGAGCKGDYRPTVERIVRISRTDVCLIVRAAGRRLVFKQGMEAATADALATQILHDAAPDNFAHTIAWDPVAARWLSEAIPGSHPPRPLNVETACRFLALQHRLVVCTDLLRQSGVPDPFDAIQRAEALLAADDRLFGIADRDGAARGCSLLRDRAWRTTPVLSDVQTWNHGDLDLPNVICRNDGTVAAIDNEKTYVASPLLNLGDLHRLVAECDCGALIERFASLWRVPVGEVTTPRMEAWHADMGCLMRLAAQRENLERARRAGELGLNPTPALRRAHAAARRMLRARGIGVDRVRHGRDRDGHDRAIASVRGE